MHTERAHAEVLNKTAALQHKSRLLKTHLVTSAVKVAPNVTFSATDCLPTSLRNTHSWSTCCATNMKLVSRLKLSWIHNTPLRNTQRCLDNTWSCKEVFNWLTVAVYIAHWLMYLVHLVHKYCTPFVQGAICKQIIDLLWETQTLLCYYALSKLSCALYLLRVTLNTAGLVQALIEI